MIRDMLSRVRDCFHVCSARNDLFIFTVMSPKRVRKAKMQSNKVLSVDILRLILQKQQLRVAITVNNVTKNKGCNTLSLCKKQRESEKELK